MTHKDIYTKFMIEYDKAGASTSYPSLTEYEVATVLDKAYNALIAQKVTGNNVRRSTLESDIKSIADLSPLIQSVVKKTKTTVEFIGDQDTNGRDMNLYSNVRKLEFDKSDRILYFVQGTIVPPNGGKTSDKTPWAAGMSDNSQYQPVGDLHKNVYLPIKLIDHSSAQGFIKSAYNLPWIKQPVGYLENNSLYIITDPLNPVNLDGAEPSSYYNVDIRYIKQPMPFVKELPANPEGYVSYFDYEVDPSSEWDGADAENTGASTYAERYEFECNDTVAEELISLAVAFALENVESQRLNSKLNMRGLEA